MSIWMLVFARKGDTRKCSLQLWNYDVRSSERKTYSAKPCKHSYLSLYGVNYMHWYVFFNSFNMFLFANIPRKCPLKTLYSLFSYCN